MGEREAIGVVNRIDRCTQVIAQELKHRGGLDA